MRTLRPLLIALLVALDLGSAAVAADKLRLERVDVASSPTVRMYLTYVDGEGRLITGRTKEEFKIVLDSADQGPANALGTFDETKEPINLVVVAQVSGVMNDVIDDVKKGIRSLLDGIDPKSKSKVGVIGYASDTKRLAELGSASDADSAVSTMNIDSEGVEVHMLDAVRTAIDWLNTAPKTERKLIVLFSDGIDINMDLKKFGEIGKLAASSGIVIDTIGYAPFEQGKLKSLAQLSVKSNGTDRQCKSTGEVNAQFRHVSDEIKKQYVARFELAVADGKDHLLQAIVDAQGKSAYSNVYNARLQRTHAVQAAAGSEKPIRWGLWLAGGGGALLVVLFIAWLIFRDKAEPMEEAPAATSPAPAAEPLRTMALDVSGGGRAPAVGWIVATSGKHVDQTFKLKPARTIIGTGADCDVVIEDQFMSAHHCEVRCEAGIFKLCDLGSTNGIVVNDRKVREHELVDNDLFRLGRTEFKFKSIG